MLDIVLTCYFFFFKQKTAYEMRISDWSSDVCSSDLPLRQGNRPRATQAWTLRAGDWVRSWSGSPKLFAGRRLEAAAQQGLCLVCVAEAGQQDRRLAGRILLVDAEKCQQPIPVARGKIGHRFPRLIALVDQIGRASCRERVCQYG